jgi:hypothetical protein
LNDRDAARRAFHRLYKDHRTAKLRDDALWEEAKLAVLDGDHDDACDVVETIIEDLPESRYVRCGRLLCKTAEIPPGAGECPDYIVRGVRGEKEDEQ